MKIVERVAASISSGCQLMRMRMPLLICVSHVLHNKEMALSECHAHLAKSLPLTKCLNECGKIAQIQSKYSKFKCFYAGQQQPC